MRASLLGLRGGLLILSLSYGCPGPQPHAALSTEDAGPDAQRDAAPGNSASSDGGLSSEEASVPPLRDDAGRVMEVEDAGTQGVADAGKLACQLGERRCAGDETQVCDDQGFWLDESVCTGRTPVCNNGFCGVYQLRGGIETISVRAPRGAYRLRSEGIINAPRMCNATLCISGGITP
jgi:hypothetical protein